MLNADQQTSWLSGLETNVARPARFGAAIVLLFLLTVGLWAIAIPLSGAVVAVGQITVAAQNQLVQHPTGGVVAKIFVSDGQDVKAGEPIMLLDQTVDRSNRDRQRARKAYLAAQQQRLQRQYDAIQTAQSLQQLETFLQNESQRIATETGGSEFTADQERQLRSSLTRLTSELAALRAQRRSLIADKAAREAERDSAAAQQSIAWKEIKRIRPIVKKGYIAKSRLDEAERRHLDAKGRQQSLTKTIASVVHRLTEIDQRTDERKSAFLQELGTELARARVEHDEVANELRASQHVLNKTEIKAPVTGRLVKLVSYTVGGVIRPNDIIAEIVPTTSDIIAEGQMSPADIETVSMKQDARIVVSALKSGLTDDLLGTVAYVSPDAIYDERKDESYYLVRINIDAEKNERSILDQLKYGMPAEIYILTGDRTFMSYLLKPMTDSFRRAFREQ